MSQSIRGGHLLHDYSKVLPLRSCLVHRNGRTFKWYEIFCVCVWGGSMRVSEAAAYPQSSDSLTLYNLIPSYHGGKAILLVPFLSNLLRTSWSAKVWLTLCVQQGICQDFRTGDAKWWDPYWNYHGRIITTSSHRTWEWQSTSFILQAASWLAAKGRFSCRGVGCFPLHKLHMATFLQSLEMHPFLSHTKHSFLNNTNPFFSLWQNLLPACGIYIRSGFLCIRCV